jgi:choline dehydrogenase
LRVTAAKAFLDPVRHRKNLTIFTNAQVSALEFKDKRAVGVRVSLGGNDAIISAEREVVLAAGAIGSPQILQLSGIGGGELLSCLGIQLVAENPNVGENLQDHLQLRMIYKIKNAVTLNQRAGSLFGKARIGAEYALKRSGPMSMAPSQLGIFAKSDPAYATANLEYHVQPLSLEKFGEPLHSFPAITMSVCNLRPEARGHIRIKSADYRDHPAIQPSYLSTETDRRVAADALRLTRRIMHTNALSRYEPDEYLPGATFGTDEELAKAAGDIGTTIFHPVGTCQMGVDERSVVDGALRVRGVESLRVADASVMPTITSGNTNSPTIMIAEKASEMILSGA